MSGAPTLLDGRYQVLGELGRGGAGVVYRCRDLELQRDVAVKLLLQGSPVGHERFAREAQAAAQLRHPGIVRVHAHGVVGDRCYAVYELIEGGRPLSEVLQAGTPEENAELIAQVAEAAGAAHAIGLVHRDLKTENVLVDAAGAPRLLDFGVALARGDARLTATGALIGTPYVMAPEQLDPHLEVGPPTDVWALGVMLYEALTGTPPFQGETLPALVTEIQRATPTPPRELRPDVPAPLAAVCLRALKPRPSARYADGAAFAEALRAAAAGRADRPRALLALGLVAALLLLLVGAALWRRGPETPLAEPSPAAPPPPAAPATPPPAGLAALDGAWTFVAGSLADARRFGAATHDGLWDGERLLVAADEQVLAWTPGAATGAPLGRHPGGALCLARDPVRGDRYSGGQDGRVQRWGARPLRLPHPRPVIALAARGDRLVSCDADHLLRLWRLAPTPEVLAQAQLTAPVAQLDLSPEGARLLVQFRQTTRFQIGPQGGTEQRLVGPPPQVFALDGLQRVHQLPETCHAACYLPGGLLVAYANRLVLLDAAFKESSALAPFEADAPIDLLAADPRGGTVVFRSAPPWRHDRPLVLPGLWRWRPGAGAPIRLAQDAVSRALRVSAAGVVAAVGVRPGVRVLRAPSTAPATAPLRRLAIAPDGRRLAARDGAGSIWELEQRGADLLAHPLQRGVAKLGNLSGALAWPVDRPLLMLGSLHLRLLRTQALGNPVQRRGGTTEGLPAELPPGRITRFLVAEGQTRAEFDDSPVAVRRRQSALPPKLTCWAQSADGARAWGWSSAGLWRLPRAGRPARVRPRYGSREAAVTLVCGARGQRALLVEPRDARRADLIEATADEHRVLAQLARPAQVAIDREARRCVVASGDAVELRSLPDYARLASLRLLPGDRVTALGFTPAGDAVWIASERLRLARLELRE